MGRYGTVGVYFPLPCPSHEPSLGVPEPKSSAALGYQASDWQGQVEEQTGAYSGAQTFLSSATGGL